MSEIPDDTKAEARRIEAMELQATLYAKMADDLRAQAAKARLARRHIGIEEERG